MSTTKRRFTNYLLTNTRRQRNIMTDKHLLTGGLMNATLCYMPKRKEKQSTDAVTITSGTPIPDKLSIVTKQIRFPDDLAYKLNVIASIKDESIAVLCDRLFRAITEAEHKRVVRDLADSVQDPRKTSH